LDHIISLKTGGYCVLRLHILIEMSHGTVVCVLNKYNFTIWWLSS